MGTTLVTQSEGPYDSPQLLQDLGRSELIFTLVILDRIFPLLDFLTFLPGAFWSLIKWSQASQSSHPNCCPYASHSD